MAEMVASVWQLVSKAGDSVAPDDPLVIWSP
jgi:hypothetical protein